MNITAETVFATARQSLHRPDFKLTIENLGYAIGLSMQHLYALEKTDAEISMSFQKIRTVVLFLSLNKLSDDHVAYMKEKKGLPKNDERLKKSYFDEFGMPLTRELDLNKFKQLLFAATDFAIYSSSFEINEDAFEVQKSLYEELLYNTFIDGIPIKEVGVDKINHDFQLWTCNDFFAEAEHERAAFNTAENILRYKVRYKTFVPNDDEFNWPFALKKIEEQARKILDDKENEPLKTYWHDKDWKSYWTIYGLPKTGLRYRIYNATSSNPLGNYIHGGRTLNSLKLRRIDPDQIIFFRDFLEKIISKDRAEPFSSTPEIFIPIEMMVCRKFPLR